MKRLTGALLLCLSLSLTGCAGTSYAPVKCQHPTVQPGTNAGLAKGLLDYKKAVDVCNALNGFKEEA